MVKLIQDNLDRLDQSKLKPKNEKDASSKANQNDDIKTKFIFKIERNYK